MNIQFFCPRWGFEHVPWEKFLSKVKHAGYNGIDYGIANNVTRQQLDQVWALLDQFQLKVIPQHGETNDANFLVHVEHYKTWLYNGC